MQPVIPGAGICDRTPRVRDAIVALIPGIHGCAPVTDAHLAALTGELSIRNAGIVSLRSDDFAGLSALNGLSLEGNRLTTLPAGIFSGMSRLRNLRLQHNALSSLPMDVFRGLPELDILDLEYNDLAALPTGLFDGLDLRFLGLEANRLRRLQARLFDSLGGDLTLDLSDNLLTTLDDGVFANLTDMVFLDLADNRLASLPAGVFEGLTAMQYLYLAGNPGADFTFTMTIERVPGADKVAVVVPEGAPFDMTTTIAASGGTLPPGVTTVTVPLGHTRSEEIAVTPLSGATVSLGAAPDVPSHMDGIATATGSPFAATSLGLVRNADPTPALAVDDAGAVEAAGATLVFAVRLDRAASRTVTVNYATADGTARAGADYRAASGTLAFAAGETRRTVSVAVLQDTHREGAETLTLTLSGASGARVGRASATGTIAESDTGFGAWLARFGRTAASQVVDAVTGRLESGSAPRLTIGGRAIPLERAPRAQFPPNGQRPSNAAYGMRARDALRGTSFAASSGGARAGPGWTAWGRIAHGGFEGEAGRTRIHGDATTGFLGADLAGDRWLAGLALGIGRGDGAVAPADRTGAGAVTSTLNALYPYAQIRLADRVDVWAIAGIGSGELTVEREPGRGGTGKTGLAMRMGAVGGRGRLRSASQGGGLDVTVKADAFWVRTRSEAADTPGGSLAASKSGVSRARLLVAASRRFATGSGILAPSVELGLRHDGGDAETGAGIEAGVGIAWSRERVTVEARLRKLLAHGDSEYRETGVSGAVSLAPGASGRGLSLTLAPAWGASAGGGTLWRAARPRGPAAGAGQAGPRLETEIGYGLNLERIPGVVTPYAGLALGGGARTARAGALWRPGSGATLALEATRGEPDSTVMLRGARRF